MSAVSPPYIVFPCVRIKASRWAIEWSLPPELPRAVFFVSGVLRWNSAHLAWRFAISLFRFLGEARPPLARRCVIHLSARVLRAHEVILASIHALRFFHFLNGNATVALEPRNLPFNSSF